MKSIKHYSIDWYVDKIKNKEYFSLAGFGDGEFYCINGRKGGNSHGCDYTPQLKDDLVAILKETSTNFYKGMNRISPKQFREIRPLLEGEWIDREILADELVKGGLKPFFEAIKTESIFIISSNEKRSVPFARAGFIETPRTNSHAEKDRIVKEILDWGQPGVYLYACGMAAGTIVHAVHNLIPNSFHIDIGHILDPFCDENMALSRDYLQNVSRETLNQNIS